MTVYRAPTSRFVAEFVGMNNILTGPGHPAGSEDEALLQTEFGPAVRAVAASAWRHAPGERISVVIGADRITLSDDDVQSNAQRTSSKAPSSVRSSWAP